ncbi:ABC transporter permease [Lysobacter antibioticus]|uniref:FtsX-like permease family protein n=1 Tax=Lysobacter antibioticus TaxID=84531 RepID=A0A0S2FG19_LYSAN|nr:FtsX-like permease family protein [Lysobacter antibioticus]ALN82483.1 ftsX-like permease family protein [Lysobacter antibioticus]
MDIRPILSTLRRHKTAAALIVFEVALTCAIICNAVFLIENRIARMQRPSGMVENELIRFSISGINEKNGADSLTQSDLAVLRSMPGVKAATVTNQVRYGSSSWNTGLELKRGQPVPTANATTYLGDEQFLKTMGLKLVAGRDFNADEVLSYRKIREPGSDYPIASAIVTRSLADALFPGQDPIGKVFYGWGDSPTHVVGVVEHLLRPTEHFGAASADYSVIFPIQVDYNSGIYLIRTDPARRQEVLKSAAEALSKNGPVRILDVDNDTLENMSDKFHQTDRSMVWLLASVCIALLIVTALGIVGLASFWVQQRTKQIGVRRALGATRGQILRYFQTENFLLTSIGIGLGMALAFAINLALMRFYELPRLPGFYLPLGALCLWLLGQLAVYGPARRAAMVPPALATRSA